MTIGKTTHLLCGLLILTAAANVRAQETLGFPVQGGAGGQSGPYSLFSTVPSALRSPGYVDLRGGIVYTSNAFLTPGHPVADGIGFAGLGIDYVHQGPDLNLDAFGNVDRLQYVNDSFPGSFYGEFNGSAMLGNSAGLLQWLVGDAFGEGMINPLTAATPTNLQTVNYARTGPYLNFNLGTADRLTLFGLYSRTTFESAPFDSQSFEGGASFRHVLSTVSSFSVQATDIHTNFLDPTVVQSFPGAAHGYDTRAASLGYIGEFGRTHFSVYGGYNTVNYGGKLRGAPLAVLQFEHRASPFSTVFLTGETGYSTLGNSLLSPTSGVASAGAQPISGTGVGALTGTAAAAPFKRTAGSLGWTYQQLRTTFTLLGTVNDVHYLEGATFDETSEAINASLRRQLGPTIFVDILGVENFGHFGQIDAANRTTTAHVQLSKHLRKLNFSGYAQWLHESSSPGRSALPVASFSDVRVGIEVSYDLIGEGLPRQIP